MKLLIVDDHKLFNDGLKSLLLSELPDLKIAQLYGSKDVLAFLQQHPQEIILLDFNLPTINGLELTIDIRKSFPSQKIIILSMYADLNQIEQFKKAGVSGYLLKTVDISELIEALDSISKGHVHFPKKASNNLHENDEFLKKFKLTQRELDVIKYIRAGKTTNEISSILNISTHTVITHRKNIHLKLGVQNERELIKFASENNI